MVSTQQFSELIGSIYDTGLDFTRWPATLDRLADAFGGSATALGRQDAVTQSGDVILARSDPVFTRRYSEYYASRNIIYQHARNLPAGTILTVLAASGRAWAIEPWPEIPLPPKADVQWVAQSMRVNGVPTRVMQFQSRTNRGEITEYYRAYWSGGYKHAPSVRAMGEATIVGQQHGPYLMAVKVEDAAHGTSSGMISVA